MKTEQIQQKEKAVAEAMGYEVKFRQGDEVYVINYEGYIGESTRAEIEYAEKQGKR
jgi:flagellar biosynthesis/type III secretory pathway M-ring protein FliF/YscJ